MPCSNICNSTVSICGCKSRLKRPLLWENIFKTQTNFTLFFESLPWPDPEQKLAVAYSGDAALSYPLSSVKVLQVCVWFTGHKPQAERVLTK